MNQDFIERALRAATRMAADRGIEVDPDALIRAMVAVAGEVEGQDEPEEIAEEALALLGKALGIPCSPRRRRPF